MDYSMDIFFRQYWTDRRLSFTGINELVVGSDFLGLFFYLDLFKFYTHEYFHLIENQRLTENKNN